MKAPHKFKNSIFRHICEQPYNERTRLKMYNSAKGNLDFIQRLALRQSLPVHNGCVNCICWNDNGEYLLSGSDDQHLVISHAYNYKMLTDYKTSHRANIFSAKFLPCSGDKNIVSCSGDGMILFTDLFRASETRNNQFNCHKGTTYEIATVPNEPHTFLSCGEDYTVRYYDLRIKEKCYKENCDEDVLISCQRAVTALAINNMRPYQMAIGCSDSTVRIFDRRMIGTKSSGFESVGGRSPKPFASFTAPGMEDRSYRITSLGFSPQGEDVLVSYSSEHLYLFSIKDESTMEYSVEASGDEEEEEESSKPMSGLPPVRRLRLRGDWSDTGPDARPERDTGRSTDAAQARPTLHATLMQRMTDVLSRMLNDPATRAALSHGGDDDHNDYVEENSRSDRLEEGAGVRSPSFLGGDPPVVAVSIEGIYSESSSQPDAEMADVPTESSQVRWSPPLASPTPTPAEDAVSLPSFESSFTPPTPPTASTSESQPSTSTGGSSNDDGSGGASSSAGGSGSRDTNLSTLTDQLSTMRHGFIERHGMEPVVNLTYSDKGMDASRISLSVADEVNRETVPQPQHSVQELPGPSSEGSPAASTNLPSVPQSGLSMDNLDSDFMMDSDDNLDEPHCPTSSTPERSSSHRKSRPIDEEMERAIKRIHKKRMTARTSTDDDEVRVKVPVRRPSVKQKFTGHRNARTMIKEATFWGDEFVMSGSDCGHVFVWERDSARLVMLLEADHHVVNCIQPHPYLPILATSGIDYDVKLWTPILFEPSFNQEMAEELVKRNEVMLEETKDTITVPASFMIRMLACLNQIRRGARSRNRRHDNSGSSDQHQD